MKIIRSCVIICDKFFKTQIIELCGSLLHIVPFCEGKNKKPEGFVKQKQPSTFAM